MEDGREKGREQSGCLSPPRSPGPALLQSGALAASLIPPELLPPSSSLPPPLSPPPPSPSPPYSLLLPENPAPCLLPPSSPPLSRRMGEGHDGSRSSMDGAATAEQQDAGPAGPTDKMAEDGPRREPRMPGVIVRLVGGSPLQSIEKPER